MASSWLCWRFGSVSSSSDPLLVDSSSVEAAWLEGSRQALVAGMAFDLSATSVVSGSCSAGSVLVDGLVVEELVLVARTASCSSCLFRCH